MDATDEPAAGFVRVVGFGGTRANGRGNPAHDKRVGEASIDSWACTPLRANRLACNPRYEIVISGGGSDTCNGDSGGPALDRDGDSWRLIAITASSLPTSPTRCGRGGIYTHVGSIADWLSDQIRKDATNE
jgi:hypothetical protein